ncbi:MAG: class I SAM-dependent methyltransferase [Planctomycetota bacterium]
MSHQQAVFEDGEADQWFRRNKDSQEILQWDEDPVCQALAACELRPGRIIDWGCSAGIRLATCCRHYQADGVGIDPSGEAIAMARERYPQLDWRQHCIDVTPALAAADLAICSFVLHWVDRARLLSSLARIDSSIVVGGHLLIYDFDPPYSQRRHYHHLPDAGLSTWKHDYAATFQATGLYRCVYRRSLAYKEGRAARPDDRERSVISILERIDPGTIPEA